MRPIAAGPASGRFGPEASPIQTRLRTLRLTRWLAVAGQLTTLLVVQVEIDGITLLPALVTVSALAAFNLWLTLAAPRHMDDNLIAWHMAFDVVQLAALIALTGGLNNPFCLFLLAPVTVAAAILPANQTALVTALALASVGVVGRWHMPLPWPGAGFAMPALYLFGAWMALMLGILSVSFFTWRTAEEVRRLAAAYAESRLALAQEQRVAEVGALAAAVAHELNTPLATMGLIARELADSLPKDAPVHIEIDTLIDQANRCNHILERFTRRREREVAIGLETVPLPALVEMAAQPYAETAKVEILFDHHASATGGESPVPWLERRPEILHGLGAFIQNAAQFARTRVEIDTRWGSGGISVRIADDGPGFPDYLLGQLGDPYVSGREGDPAHLGLGIFIATTLLARTGASVSFANAADGGAEVVVAWGMGDA